MISPICYVSFSPRFESGDVTRAAATDANYQAFPADVNKSLRTIAKHVLCFREAGNSMAYG